MAHNIIIGMTESGKTSLAKIMSMRLKLRDMNVAVLDPLSDPGWQCDFITGDSEEFLQFSKTNKSHTLFVDEGSTSIGKYNVPMEWLATQSRHLGHSCFFISQRAIQLPVIIRDQCSNAFIFACSERDSDLFSEEWNEPDLKKCPKLEPGEFYLVRRFLPILRGKLDFSSQTCYITDNEA